MVKNVSADKLIIAFLKEKIKKGKIEHAEKLISQLLEINPHAIYLRALADSITKIKKSHIVDGNTSIPAISENKSEHQIQKTYKSPTTDVKTAQAASVSKQLLPSGDLSNIKAEVIVETWQDGSKIDSAILKIYKRILQTVWQDGILPEDEKNQLEDIRRSLNITPAQHTAMESETRMNLFLQNASRE